MCGENGFRGCSVFCKELKGDVENSCALNIFVGLFIVWPLGLVLGFI